MELSAAEVKSKSRKLPFQFPFLCGPRVWGLPTEGTLLLVDGSMGESEYHGMPPLGFCLELVPWLGLPSYHSGMPSKTRVRGQPESFSMIRGSHGKALTPDSASGLCRSCPAGCLQQIRADSRLSWGGDEKAHGVRLLPSCHFSEFFLGLSDSLSLHSPLSATPRNAHVAPGPLQFHTCAPLGSSECLSFLLPIYPRGPFETRISAQWSVHGYAAQSVAFEV